jgi:hypothetical protein
VKFAIVKKFSSDFRPVHIRLQDIIRNHLKAIESNSFLNFQQREMMDIQRSIKKMNLSPYFISRSLVYKFLCIGFAGKFDDLSLRIRESIRLMKSNGQISILLKQIITEDDKQKLAESEQFAKSKTELLHQVADSYKEAVENIQNNFKDISTLQYNPTAFLKSIKNILHKANQDQADKLLAFQRIAQMKEMKKNFTKELLKKGTN